MPLSYNKAVYINIYIIKTGRLHFKLMGTNITESGVYLRFSICQYVTINHKNMQ